MDYSTLVLDLMHRANMSYQGLSRALGKSDSYTSATLGQLKQGGKLNADTLTAIAKACGCSVVVVDDTTGEEVAHLSVG